MKSKSGSFTKLVSREQFKEMAFKRDGYKCVFCSETKISCHHILDRKLFADGGYYVDNGASVCDKHHWDCEKTDLSVEVVRKACGIENIIVPEGFDKQKIYDKWCNVILPDGRREPGPMFFEENVQKVLKDKIWLFNI